jgi:hypothetical protein
VFDRSVFAVLWLSKCSSVRLSDAAATDVVSALSADQFASTGYLQLLLNFNNITYLYGQVAS